jgi:hypothetical protein
LVLLVAGLVYVCVGLSYMFGDSPASREIALQIALHWWNFQIWGGIFTFSGLLTIVSSRWPPVSETWGYTVLTGLSVGWGCFYAAGVIFGNSPTGNLSGFLTWGLLGFLWWAISGLTNPTVVVIHHPPVPLEHEGSGNGYDERS